MLGESLASVHTKQPQQFSNFCTLLLKKNEIKKYNHLNTFVRRLEISYYSPGDVLRQLRSEVGLVRAEGGLRQVFLIISWCQSPSESILLRWVKGEGRGGG